LLRDASPDLERAQRFHPIKGRWFKSSPRNQRRRRVTAHAVTILGLLGLLTHHVFLLSFFQRRSLEDLRKERDCGNSEQAEDTYRSGEGTAIAQERQRVDD
jgi:hypothetical protein